MNEERDILPGDLILVISMVIYSVGVLFCAIAIADKTTLTIIEKTTAILLWPIVVPILVAEFMRVKL